MKINFFLKSIFFTSSFFVCTSWIHCLAMQDDSEVSYDDIEVDFGEEGEDVEEAPPAKIVKEKLAPPAVTKEDFAGKLRIFNSDVDKSVMDLKSSKDKILQNLSFFVSNIGTATVDQIQGLINAVNFYLSLLKDSMKQDKNFDSIENNFRSLLAQATKELWLKKGVVPAELKESGVQGVQPAQASSPVVVRLVQQQVQPRVKSSAVGRGVQTDKKRRSY